MRHAVTTTLFLAGAMLATVGRAEAEFIRFDFTALVTLTDPAGGYGGTVPGDVFTASVVFDSSVTSTGGTYTFDAAGGMPVGIAAEIGWRSLSADVFDIQVADATDAGDGYIVITPQAQVGESYFRIALYSGKDVDLFSGTELPLEPLNLNVFNGPDAQNSGEVHFRDEDQYQTTRSYFTITSWTRIRPDLAVENLTVSPAHATFGEPVSVQATVRNAGTGTVAPSLAAVIFDKQGDGEGAFAAPIPELAPGESATSRVTTSTLSAGQYEVRFVADLPQAVEEITEANNQAQAPLQIDPLGADLTIAGLAVSPARPREQLWSAFTVSARVQNVGDRPAAASTMAFRVGGTTSEVVFDVPALQPTQHHAVRKKFVLANTRRLELEAVADADRQVKEGNESNNAAQLRWSFGGTTIRIATPGGADLVVSRLSVERVTIDSVVRYQLAGMVRNVGTAPAGPSALAIRLERRKDADLHALPTLAAGATRSFAKLVPLRSGASSGALVVADAKPGGRRVRRGEQYLRHRLAVRRPVSQTRQASASAFGPSPPHQVSM